MGNMNGFELTSSVLGHLVSWPVLVLVVTWVFKKPIGELIGRIRSYEGLGQKVTFGEQLADAEDSVQEARKSTEAETTEPEGLDVVDLDPLAREAEVNPSFVILTAWEQLL